VTAGNRPILAVAGLAAEARIARSVGWTAVVAGGRAGLLRERLAALPGDWAAVVSFGIAGGLDPALKPGTVIVADRIVAADRDFRCDAALADAIAAALPAAPRTGALAAVEAPLLRPADKEALHARTGALAADMESHIAAAYAAERGVPFAAVRVVCDPAGRALPALAATALKPDGTSDLAAVLRGLARDPAALPRIIRLASDSSVALATLRKIAPAVAAALGS
jgi:hopanoid-associated phosphorylase